MRELTASSLTGSITLRYCEALQPIITAAADQKLLETGRSNPQKTMQVETGLRWCEGSELAGGIAAALSGLGLFQITHANALGSAVETLVRFRNESLVGRTHNFVMR